VFQSWKRAEDFEAGKSMLLSHRRHGEEAEAEAGGDSRE